MASIRRGYAGDLPMRSLLHWPLLLVGGQVVLGAVNIVLAAPGWLQIAHLLGAQVLWVAVCASYLAMGRRVG